MLVTPTRCAKTNASVTQCWAYCIMRPVVTIIVSFLAHTVKSLKTELYQNQKYVIVGSSKEVDHDDVSALISDADRVARINLNVVRGQVWMPRSVIMHTTFRTDVVCHHSMQLGQHNILKKKIRKEVAFTDANVAAYAKHGIREVICLALHNCHHVTSLSSEKLVIRGPSAETLKWSRKRQPSTGLKCIFELLAMNVSELFVFGMDFHNGGCSKSFYRGYNDFHVPKGFNTKRITLAQQGNHYHNFSNEFKFFQRLYVEMFPKIQVSKHLRNLLVKGPPCRRLEDKPSLRPEV